jgi:hypothetical protein
MTALHVYTDRSYTFIDLGDLATLPGLRYVATSMDDKNFVARSFLELQAARGTSIYLAFDLRANPVTHQPRTQPSWLKEELFTPVPAGKRRILTTDTDADFTVFRLGPSSADRRITLGGNIDSPLPYDQVSMYLIFYQGELTAARGWRPAPPGGPAPETAIHPVRQSTAEICSHGQRQVDENQLRSVLAKHRAWVADHHSGQRADFTCMRFPPLDFSGASIDFRAADLNGVQLEGSNLSTARLDDAEMKRANLANAILVRTSLRRANLLLANLSSTNLAGADLSGSNLSGAALRDADFTGTRVAGALFEPASLPDVRRIARAEGLDRLEYLHFPDTLISLRESFKQAGFRDQERAITAAIERHRAASAPWYERRLRQVVLGLTCDYGLATYRPLLLLAASIVIFPLLYWLCARAFPNSRLLLAAGATSTDQVCPTTGKRWRHYFKLSVLSAFALGEQGRIASWIERLLPASDSVRPTGAIRTLSGIQSLVSLLLLALWALVFVGRPFE